METTSAPPAVGPAVRGLAPDLRQDLRRDPLPTAGLHPAWGLLVGLVLQGGAAVMAVAGLVTLGPSFGLRRRRPGPGDRRPYAVVRHPMYLAYVLGCLCNVSRAVIEDRLLAGNPQHVAFRRRVRWAMLPGIW